MEAYSHWGGSEYGSRKQNYTDPMDPNPHHVISDQILLPDTARDPDIELKIKSLKIF